MQQEFLYIYQVYESGSFSKAAEKLYLTQPALSIAVQKTEASIGMPLFDRTRRPLQLTQAGEAYIHMIKTMQSLESDLERQIQDIRELNTGTLRLGGSHYLNACILPPVLSGFGREYPGIQLDLVEYGSDQLSEMLKERRLDLTFSCNQEFISSFERYPAFYDHILLAVPAELAVNQKLTRYRLSSADICSGRHLEDGCPSLPLAHFQDQDFILLTPGNNLYDRGMQMFREAGFAPRIRLSLSQLVTAYELARHQMAVTFASDRLVRREDTGLCFYKIDSSLTRRLFYMLLPDRSYTSHAVKAFIQYFLTNFPVRGTSLKGRSPLFS